jgi:hypothetical protein
MKKCEKLKFDGLRAGLITGMVEERKAKLISRGSEHGRSYYIVACPFCTNHIKAFIWSLSGCGKRCEDCSALMTSSGSVYQWKWPDKPDNFPSKEQRDYFNEYGAQKFLNGEFKAENSKQ